MNNAIIFHRNLIYGGITFLKRVLDGDRP
jgi:hypothetical protein